MLAAGIAAASMIPMSTADIFFIKILLLNVCPCRPDIKKVLISHGTSSVPELRIPKKCEELSNRL
jgi:hypothetical protein